MMNRVVRPKIVSTCNFSSWFKPKKPIFDGTAPLLFSYDSNYIIRVTGTESFAPVNLLKAIDLSRAPKSSTYQFYDDQLIALRAIQNNQLDLALQHSEKIIAYTTQFKKTNAQIYQYAITGYSYAGSILSAQGNFSEAIKMYKKAVTVSKETQYFSISEYIQLISCYINMNYLPVATYEAQKLYDYIFDNAKTPPNIAKLAQAQSLLGICYVLSNEPDRSLKLFQNIIQSTTALWFVRAYTNQQEYGSYKYNYLLMKMLNNAADDIELYDQASKEKYLVEKEELKELATYFNIELPLFASENHPKYTG